MIAILKTLPARFARGEILRFLGCDGKPCWTQYFFQLGRACPQRAKAIAGSWRVGSQLIDGFRGVEQIHFTHRGILLGHFDVQLIAQNAGQFPILTTMDGGASDWQLKPDRWVVVCAPPFHRLKDRIYHEAFRGWRYFDLDAYRGTREAKVRL